MYRRLRDALSPRMADISRRERALLAGAMVASFVVVVVYILVTRPHALTADEVEYNLEGVFFTQGKFWWSTTPFGIAHASAWKAPGYPAWVGLWYWVLGAVPFRVELVQSLLAPLTVFLTWVLGRRLFDSRVALVAAWIVAFFPLAFEYYGLLFPEALAVPLTLAVLVAAFGRTPTPRLALVVGLLVGLNLLVRPNAFFLLAGVAAAWIVAVGWRRGLSFTACAAAIAALVVLPWTIRNTIVNDGGVIPISVQDGALYGTFNAQSANDPDYPYAWRATPAGVNKVINPDKPISDADFRSRLQNAAFDYIKAHPASVPQAFFWNGLVRFWDVRPPDQALREADFQGRSDFVRAIGLGMYFVILPLALFGLWQARRRREVLVPILALFVAASVTFTVIAGTRYRAPIEPLLVVLAGAALAGRVTVPAPGGPLAPATRSPAA